jgi:hypothetical protein
VLVYVDDVGEHYARAKAAGAVILSEPEDGPTARRYRVEDLEEHPWVFMARDYPSRCSFAIADAGPCGFNRDERFGLRPNERCS